MAAAARLAPALEKARYETHNNDVEDPAYQRFAQPLVTAVCKYFTPQHAGLDFGSGHGPVTSKLLQDRGYNIQQYDPFFCIKPALLDNTYDYIVSCEVIEHFYQPLFEFKRLLRLLNRGGRLICKTHPYTRDLDFSRWYYKNDETHVFIYQAQTFEWIKENVGFSSLEINDRIIEFGK